MLRAVDEYNENGHIIYADNYLGAFVRGATRDEALAKFPAELASYCAWCRLPLPENGLQIVQEKYSTLQICDADSDVLFDSERGPLTRDGYEKRKALALRSARDFLALYRSVPDKDATTLTPRRTFYGEIPVTARQMYEHTKSVNSYYFGELGVTVGNEPDIAACRQAGFEALEKQPDFLQNRVFCGSYDELWSLKKLLRRFVWHDRIHARAMFRMATKLCGAGVLQDPYCFGKHI